MRCLVSGHDVDHPYGGMCVESSEMVADVDVGTTPQKNSHVFTLRVLCGACVVLAFATRVRSDCHN